MYDTIVIGAGLAGLMAALGRAEQGQRVLLLAKGNGTTHWSTGCIDLLDAPDNEQNPRAALEQLVGAQPEHPYALVGMAGIEAALGRLRALCEAAGYPLVGDMRRNVLLPTAVGALRPTCLLPLTMAAGDTRLLATADGGRATGDQQATGVGLDGSEHNRPSSAFNRPTLIAGFHELRDFFPPLLAANLQAQGYAAHGVYLELPPTSRRLDFSTMTFARLFDQPAFRMHVGRQLRKLVREGGYARVALPAVLGLEHPADVVRDLQAAAEALIFEVPTLPTSVPGVRLYRILERALQRAGGRVQLGSQVLRAVGKHGRLETVSSEAAARLQEHRAERFVLATGGIAGGGVRGDHTGALHETAMGLPLRAPAGREAWFNARLLDEAGHAVFRSGVVVDRQFRPLDADERVVYDNVAVVGAALAGVDVIRTGCAEGLAVATGFAVGKV